MMVQKDLDVRRCHLDTPEFNSEVQQQEESLANVEKQYRHIINLFKEKRVVLERDRVLSEQILKEFEFLSNRQMSEDSEEGSIIQLTLSTMRQTVDHQQRLVEQISKGVMKPMQELLDEDFKELKRQKKEFWKSQSETHSLIDKLCQCKKHDIPILGDLAIQVFDARSNYHKAACSYISTLKHMQGRTKADCLEKMTDLMMSEISYFHVGKITMDDIQPCVQRMYQLAETDKADSQVELEEQRSKAKEAISEVLLSRSRDLVAFHTYDLHQPADNAITNVTRHLQKNYPELVYDTKSLLPPVTSQDAKHIDSGYLLLGELKQFGLTFAWKKLFFQIKNELLVCQDPNGKKKHPVVLNLNLCTVKEYNHPNLERNFCFKVISPAKTLLLQAESSLEVRSWITSLTDAIGQSLTTPPLTQPLSNPANSQFTTRGHTANQGTPEVQRPAAKMLSTSVIKELYSIPGNDACADCGTSKPKWASVSLGILICIECSGAHRSLGVSISKVRSLTLDTLSDSAIDKLKQVGNTRANQIYEACLPEDFDKDSVRDAANRQKFIRDKYFDLSYTTDDERSIIKEKRAKQLRKTLGSDRTEKTPPARAILAPSTKTPADSDSDEDIIIKAPGPPGQKVNQKR